MNRLIIISVLAFCATAAHADAIPNIDNWSTFAPSTELRPNTSNWVMMQTTHCISIGGPNQLRMCDDGVATWRGHAIEDDAEFTAAVKLLVKHAEGKCHE